MAKPESAAGSSASRQPETPDQIAAAIRAWQPRSKRLLSSEDGREIVANVAGFFGVLAEWAARRKSDPGRWNMPPAGEKKS